MSSSTPKRQKTVHPTPQEGGEPVSPASPSPEPVSPPPWTPPRSTCFVLREESEVVILIGKGPSTWPSGTICVDWDAKTPLRRDLMAWAHVLYNRFAQGLTDSRVRDDAEYDQTRNWGEVRPDSGQYSVAAQAPNTERVYRTELTVVATLY